MFSRHNEGKKMGTIWKILGPKCMYHFESLICTCIYIFISPWRRSNHVLRDIDQISECEADFFKHFEMKMWNNNQIAVCCFPSSIFRLEKQNNTLTRIQFGFDTRLIYIDALRLHQPFLTMAILDGIVEIGFECNTETMCILRLEQNSELRIDQKIRQKKRTWIEAFCRRSEILNAPFSRWLDAQFISSTVDQCTHQLMVNADLSFACVEKHLQDENVPLFEIYVSLCFCWDFHVKNGQ